MSSTISNKSLEISQISPTIPSKPSTTKDVSLVSTISKVAANILIGLIVLTPVLLPISVVGGKKNKNKTKKLIK